MRKYNIINNSLGWFTFLVAAITYLLTIEPTASFWDCPEFIAQGYKAEVGHPPGNPIYILVARLAACFAGGDVMAVSKCVNAMSALLSAATILLLFWTITHLVKRLVVKDGKEDEMTLAQYLVVMGSGLCGALVYTWSDTFWFSAVEAEVYAFSSFCTALVFWLILKWENRADSPTSDRWIILIAYVFGFSLGVHLLNLLCIPAIALVFYYRKVKDSNAKGSLITLLVSFAIVGVILYGLEPGFVELGGYFDLFFVNTLGMGYNSGVIVYCVLLLAAIAWCVWELKKEADENRMKISFLVAVLLSGIPFIGSSLLIPIIIVIALGVYLFRFVKKVPVRIFSNIILSIFMIFVGFTCYGLILIRSSANTPLDENSPNSAYALNSYLSRDQYGKSPLLYGQVYTANPQLEFNGNSLKYRSVNGKTQYSRVVKKNESDPDRYVVTGHDFDIAYPSGVCMFFPRMHSSMPNHVKYYNDFLDVENHPLTQVDLSKDMIVDKDGNSVEDYNIISFVEQNYNMSSTGTKPSFGQNLEFFFGYQLHYMYWRYFMWNFAGRQNDIQGLSASDLTHGNWISGIPFIDNARLGDQSLLPADYTTGNKGHNVFFCLPLLLGLIGVLWQAFSSKRGIEQFWVVFFLFFMTGIAIVLYLNQTPLQPRERDYAYAGSFYAFAIWVGMGVAGIWRCIVWFMKRSKATGNQEKDAVIEQQVLTGKPAMAMAAIAAVIGLFVPLQMVSQTWDDHDRSGRYCARDFGMNYLSSVDKDGIIFTNGDNDTFPLWYLQEVEGYRTDVRVVNLSYLATDWYIAQMQRAAYDSKPLPMLADQYTYAYGDRQGSSVDFESNPELTPLTKSLKELYTDESNKNEDGRITGNVKYPNTFIPINAEQAIKAGVVTEQERDQVLEAIPVDISQGSMTSSDIMTLDLIASSIDGGWKRPCYFAMTVADDLYSRFAPYIRNTGMAYQIVPIDYGTQNRSDVPCYTDKMYENVTKKFRWGGLDTAEPGSIYLDETVRRMVETTRAAMVSLAYDLTQEGIAGKAAQASGQSEFMGKPANEYTNDRFQKALNILNLMEQKLPEKACSFTLNMGGMQRLAEIYHTIGTEMGKPELVKKAVGIVESEILRYSQYMIYYQSIGDYINGLSNYDQNVFKYYYPHLFSYYKEINPNGYNAMLKKVKGMGVYTNEVENYVKQYEQQKRLEAKYSPEELEAMYEAAQRQQEAPGIPTGEGEDAGFVMPNAQAAAQEDQNVMHN